MKHEATALIPIGASGSPTDIKTKTLALARLPGHLCPESRASAGVCPYSTGTRAILEAEVIELLSARQFLQRRLRARRTRTIGKFHRREHTRGRIGTGIARADAEHMFRKTALKIGGDACVVTAVLALEQIQHPR